MAGTSNAHANANATPDASKPLPSGGVAAWVNRWRITARLYEPLWRQRSLSILTLGAFSTARELDTLHAWLAPLENLTVLDVGCSAGLYARTLARAGARVTAIDNSPAFVREAARLSARDGVSVSTMVADAHALPFADAGFDAVVVGATLNELADPARALRECARVLRPGGRLFFMFARQAGPLGRPLQALLALGGLRFPAPTQLDAWSQAAGFVPIRLEVRGPVALALYGLGAGVPPVAQTSLMPGYEHPTPRRNRRFNWERKLNERADG